MSKTINKPIEKTESIPLINLKPLLGIIIAAFAFILYAQSISFDYTLDDVTVTKENKVVKKGFGGIPEIMTKDYWYGYNDNLRVPEYRPTSLLVLAAEWQFFPENPQFSHFINVLLYALTCWLLFLLLCKLFEKQNLIIPFVCSLLYVAHPIHTEVVDNIKSLDEILCFLFFVTSAFFIVKYTSSKSIVSLVLGSSFCFLSLLSKETGITFLVAIPLLLFCFNKGSIKNILSIFLILLGVSGLYFLIRYFVLKDIPHNHLESWLNNSLYSTSDFMIQRATAFGVLVRYILLLIFPHPLSYDYSFNQIKMISFTDPFAIAGVTIYAALIILAIILLRKKSFLAAGILFYLVTLSPVSNIFLLINSTMAERFMYIPSFGFCLALTFILIKITKTDTHKIKSQSITEFIKGKVIILSILLVITVLYSFKTITRTQDWKDDPTLFSHDVKTVENSGRAHYNYANTLLISVYPNEINPSKKDIMLREIISEFNKALEIYPNFPNAYNYLSTAYIYQEDYKNALISLDKYNSIRTVPDSLVHSNFAFLYEKTQQYDREISELDTILSYNNQNPQLHLNKGIALGRKGDDSLAMVEFKTVLELNPSSSIALKNLGVAYAKKNQYKTALEYFNKCNQVDSTDIENINYMGMVYQNTGDTDNARKNFEKVARLRKK